MAQILFDGSGERSRLGSLCYHILESTRSGVAAKSRYREASKQAVQAMQAGLLQLLVTRSQSQPVQEYHDS